MSTIEVARDDAADERAPADQDQRRRPRPVSRRSLLGVLGATATLAACADLPDLGTVTEPGGTPSKGDGGGSTPGGKTDPPADPNGMGTPPRQPMMPVAAGPMPTVKAEDEVVHLLSRATFGVTAAEVARAREMSAGAWLAEQLSDGLDDGGIEGQLANQYPDLRKTAGQLLAGENADRIGREIVAEAMVLRAAFSKRQLFERMVEFWDDHLNVPAFPSNNHLAARKVEEEREVIRKHALGRFADLIQTQAKSPAMLGYLDQERSRGDGNNVPNENYARELMEIHTVGVEAGYTEDEVKAAAALLTGFSVDDNNNPKFRYRPEWHATGPVEILGFTSANDSEDAQVETEKFIDYLAHHPSTAQRLATKLALKFVAEEPQEALVAELAQVYLDNDTQIAPVLEALFTSKAFADSVGQKISRPMEDVVGAVRALGFTPAGNLENRDRLRNMLGRMGQEPYQHASPYGYPLSGVAWIDSGTLLERWNFHQRLVDGEFNGLLSGADDALGKLVDPVPETAGELVDALADRLVAQPLMDEHRAALLDYVGVAEADAVGGKANDLIMQLAVAILDSPYFIQR